FEHRGRVEHSVGQDRRARDQRRHDPRLVPEGVDEGVDDQIPVAGAQAHDVGPVGIGAKGLSVRAHGPLGPTGRSRREEDVGHVVGLDGADPSVDVLLTHGLAVPDEIGPSHGVVRRLAPDDHHVLEGGQVLALGFEHGQVVGAEEVGDRQEHLGAALLQDVRRLRALEAGVDGDEHGAGGVQTAERDDPLPHVGHPDGDPVAGLDAEGDEGACRLARRPVQLPEREAHRAVHDLFTDHAVYIERVLGHMTGRREIKPWITQIMAAYPELYTVYEWHMIDGDRVVFYMQNRRDNPEPGAPPLDFPGISILHYAGGG